jgi:hypothetical protein
VSILGRLAVADIGDLEAQGAKDACGAVYATAEVVGTERTAGRELVGDAENGLGVVAFVAEDQQIGAGRTETVAGEKLILSQLVIFGRCLPDVMGLNGIPECHL